MAWELTVGECAETMRSMPADSVDAIVCDPPYGLRFMGKEFDSLGDGIAQQEWHRAWTTEAFRVLKPGGFLMAFGGTRTYHRLVLAVEQSGFDAHGVWAWCYGSGFPKSHSIGKAIDKAAGAEREVIGEKECGYQVSISKTRVEQGHRPNETAATTIVPITAPATADAKKWDGWGTALKPAWEPIVIASKGTGRGLTGSVLHASTLPRLAAGDIVNRLKPGANVIVLGKLDNEGTVLHAKATAVLEDAGLEIRDCGAVITADGLLSVLFARKPPEGTVAANTLKHGVGGLNIDVSRIGIADGDEPVAGRRTANFGTQETVSGGNGSGGWEAATGRWPANLLLEHTPECRKTGAVAEVTGGGTAGTSGFAAGYEAGDGRVVTSESWVCGDSCPVKELDEQGGESVSTGGRIGKKSQSNVTNVPVGDYEAGDPGFGDKGGPSRFFHQDATALSPLPFDAAPEQAPLLAYLLRLITPEGGAILGSFDDSVTRKTAESKGFRFIGVTRRNDG